MATSYKELVVDKRLIDSKFSGYKLSLDAQPVYRLNVKSGVEVVELDPSQSSFNHLKCLGVHNHLVEDEWADGSVYCIDATGSVIHITWSQRFQWDHAMCFHMDQDTYSLQAYTVYKTGDRSVVKPRCHMSLTFVSPDLCILTDGCGELRVINTGQRSSSDTQWQLVQTFHPLPDHPTFVISASLYHTTSDPATPDPATPDPASALSVECVLLHIKESEQTSAAYTPNKVHLDWITYASEDGKEWNQTRTRRLKSSRGPDFLHILPGGRGVCVRGERPFTMTHDSVKPVVKPPPPEPQPPEPNLNGMDPDRPTFTWTNEEDWINVEFPLDQDVMKADVEFEITKQTVKLGLSGGKVLMDGELFAGVDVGASTWSLEHRKVILSLSKLDPSPWPTVVIPNNSTDTPGATDVSGGLLDHLTSDQWNPDPGRETKAFNSEQLEECDESVEDGAVMQTIDGESHATTVQVACSNQWLLNSRIHGNNAATMCLRHDVDGLVWKPPSACDQSWSHVATLNAFGYVLASKKPQFCASAPDQSYAVIAEYTRHVYVYHQSSPVATTLRNRNTGERVESLCKQQVISLDSKDKIIGLRAQNKDLFILTENDIFRVTVH